MDVLKELARVGVYGNMNALEQQRVILSNKLLLLGIISSSLFIILDLCMGLYIPSALLFFNGLVLSFCMFLNSKRINNLSGFIGVQTTALTALVISYFINADVGAQYVLIGLIGVPTITLNFDKRILMILSMLNCGAMAISIVLFDFDKMGIYELGPRDRLQLLFGDLSLSLVLICSEFFMLFEQIDIQFKNFKENQEKMNSQSRMSDLGLISAGIAHEINNPMTVIQLNTQLLIRSLENDKFEKNKFKERSQNILKHCQRILKIVSGLKFISRDGGKDPFENIDLRQTIVDILIITQEKFKRDGITIETDIPFYMVIVKARIVQIEQVLLSLIGNATDAMENQQIKRISLKMKVLDEMVQIIVEDNGTGIPSKIKDEIMKPFFTTKPVGKGTGLGLSVAKGIMQEHLGDLEVDSQCSSGRFILSFPLIKIVDKEDRITG